MLTPKSVGAYAFCMQVLRSTSTTKVISPTLFLLPTSQPGLWFKAIKMKLLLSVAISFVFSINCKCQVVKMRVREFAFIPNMADSNKAPIFLPVDRLAFIDYNSLKITVFGANDDVYYIVDYQKLEPTKMGDRYLFNCVRDDSKRCRITMSVWTDKAHKFQVYMRIKSPSSLNIYNLDFIEE